MAGRQSDLKSESWRKLAQTKSKLIAFFGVRTSLRAITADQAAEWRQWLVGLGLSEATVKTHAGNAKTFFHEAVRRKLVVESAFTGLRSGATACANERYVKPEEMEKVLAECPYARWRLLIGLARLVGLRIPSESYELTCADVDWERHRLTVRSPKTERYRGHEQRVVPLTPRLMKLVQDRFDELRDGEEYLVRLRGGCVRRTLDGVFKRAGVEPWPKLFQTLRASCERNGR